MRQRNIKNLDEKIAASASRLVEEPRLLKGHWAEHFGNDNPIYLEIGCGKGNFVVSHAEAEHDCNFIACEGQASVVLRALEKAEANGLDNLCIFIDYVHDLNDYFEQGEIAGIYLNFSDPWPKARHAKRRLTYRDYLKNYKQVLTEGGFIEFKTDNDDLFEFTLEEIAECGFEIVEMTRDLHCCTKEAIADETCGCDAEGGNKSESIESADANDKTTATYAAVSRRFMTEYEQKFSRQGKNINFVRI